MSDREEKQPAIKGEHADLFLKHCAFKRVTLYQMKMENSMFFFLSRVKKFQ